MSEPSMDLVQQDDELKVAFSGGLSSLSEGTLRDMRDRLNSAIDRDHPAHVIVDVGAVSYFGTGFVELILLVLGRVRRRGGDLTVQGLNRACLEVLENCGLSALIPLHHAAPPEAWWG